MATCIAATGSSGPKGATSSATSVGPSPPNGSLFATLPERHGLWTIRELTIANRPNGRLGHYVLGFGQDDRGEVYVGVRDVLGPTGTTGRVYKLVSAEDEDDDDEDDDDDN